MTTLHQMVLITQVWSYVMLAVLINCKKLDMTHELHSLQYLIFDPILINVYVYFWQFYIIKINFILK